MGRPNRERSGDEENPTRESQELREAQDITLAPATRGTREPQEPPHIKSAHATGETHKNIYTEYKKHKDPPGYPDGYPRFAGLMACADNLAVFRKFNRMSYQSLLFQQSQLLELEQEINNMEQRDRDLIDLSVAVQDRLIGSGGKSYPTTSRDQQWLELIFEVNEYGTQTHKVVAHGPWGNFEQTSIKQSFSIKLVFELGKVFPAVVWDSKENNSESAWWELDYALPPKYENNSTTAFKVQSHLGTEFENLLETLDLTANSTLHFFLKFPVGDLTDWENGFLVHSGYDGRVSYVILVQDNKKFRVSSELRELSDPDKITTCQTLQYLSDLRFDSLRDAAIMANSSQPGDILRVHALHQLEHKLSAYKSALIQQAQTARLEGPSTRGLDTIRRWLWRDDPHKDDLKLARTDPESFNTLPLQGLARDIYTQRDDIGDLVAVGPSTPKDYLSRILDYFFGSLLKTRKKPAPMKDLGPIYFYSTSFMSTLVSVVGSFLGVGLLIGAIVGLDQLDSKATRLGLICALTVVFALVLVFTTTSTRGEVFGASAAYAAVLVVYVGGALDNSGVGDSNNFSNGTAFS